jgi:ABC-type bacteriocin/lantibiotic exporter with double-glycine peptidase domain
MLQVGLHKVSDKMLDEEATNYENQEGEFDEIALAQEQHMNFFNLGIRVGMLVWGSKQVSTGELGMSTFIAFMGSLEGLIDLLIGDSGLLSGVQRQFDVSCGPLRNLLGLQGVCLTPNSGHFIINIVCIL